MAIPATRADFKKYCLRRIGAPVIDINVDDDQVEDRIDEALTFFWDYHFEGAEKTYYKYQIQAADITNKYITLPSNIIGAVNIFPVGESLSSNNLFNIRYQITLNDLYDLTATTMVPYYLAMQHIQFLEQLLVGQQPLRFNRYTNILHLDMAWDITYPGQFLIVEAYQVIDPTVYAGVWGDRWLSRYATALIKRQWGDNLTKYTAVNLPGGNKFNADKIRDDAQKEVEMLEQEMIKTWSLPVSDLIG
jgi:hypothetical protein